MLRVKKLPIYAGTNIAVLNPKDARKLGVHTSDRVIVKNANKEKCVIVELDVTGSIVKEGEVGLFVDVKEFEEGEEVKIEPAPLPESVRYIRKKIRGIELSKDEIKKIVNDIFYDRLLSIEIASYLTAVQTVGMSLSEIKSLTEAMVEVGKCVEWPSGWKILDKHCIGGIPNNRTTPIVVSIVASLGLKIPKTSSRAITSPAGTADVVEVLAPVEFTIDEIREIVSKVNGCMVWGGALDISPVDDKLIKVERALDLDPEGQVIASVLSKKKAMGSRFVVIDIPYGEYAKVKTLDKAKEMAIKFKEVGRSLGMRLEVVITDGSHPIGNGIGPVLEMIDILKILKREKDRPLDLEEKALEIAGKLLEVSGEGNYQKAKSVLESGKAYDRFIKIIEAQGGSVKRDLEALLGKYVYDVKSPVPGRVSKVINTLIAHTAKILGAPESKGSGLLLFKKTGDKISRGETIFRMYSESEYKLDLALKFIKENFPYEIQSKEKFIVEEI